MRIFSIGTSESHDDSMIGDGLVVIHRSDASLSRGAVFQCLPIVPLTCVLSVLFLMQYAALLRNEDRRLLF